MSISFKKLGLLSLSIGVSMAFAELQLVMNQVGFETKGFKNAVLVGEESVGSLEIRSVSGQVQNIDISVGELKEWIPAQHQARLIDFSSLQTPGEYAIYRNGEPLGRTFKVESGVYLDALHKSLKFFYFNRASIELVEEYAGIYARPAGHPDTNVFRHISYEEKGWAWAYPDSISAAKGWYDAGDYGKYTVNSGIANYTLQALYEHFSDFMSKQTWNIPESGSETPDVLSEIRWNTDWLLDMQLESGAVPHRLTTLRHAATVMPNQDLGRRFYFLPSTSATYAFAGIMAQMARLIHPFDREYSQRCIEAAIKAWAWSQANPWEEFVQPAGANTGEYGKSSVSAERRWAAIELGLTTGNQDYFDKAALYIIGANVPGWADISALSYLAQATSNPDWGMPEEMREDAKISILFQADRLLKTAEEASYGISMARGHYYWGSNGVAANQGMILLNAFYLTGEDKYLWAAQGILDYLLGRNPLDISYVTGVGHVWPKNPHHRPSARDEVDEPVPGMIVGGPNPNNRTSDACSPPLGAPPAMSFVDVYCNYSTNEIAINWNAPFAYLVGAISAIYSAEDPKQAFKPLASFDYENLRSPTQKIDPRVKNLPSYLQFNGRTMEVKTPHGILNSAGQKIK
jgi:endoglucanase